MARTSIDIKEVAIALTQMFEASVDLVEKEPDMDVILDILHEHFPGIGMEEIREAGALVGFADQFNDK